MPPLSKFECASEVYFRGRGEVIPGCNADRIESAIPRAACTKDIKDRQEAIQRFFPVTAYTLGVC